MASRQIFAIVSNDGTVHRTFDKLEDARRFLYGMSAPVGNHPRLMQKRRSAPDDQWVPVGIGLV